MRHLYLLLLTLAGATVLAFSACVKAPQVTISTPENIELSADGSSGSITFTANRDWSIRCSESWISVTPSSGQASKDAITVRVSCGANTTYEDRQATVTITAEDAVQTTIIKQPANLGIVLPTQSFNIASDARSIEVQVQANVQYTVSVSADWIKQTGTKGLTSNTLTFSIEQNETYDARSANIIIKPQNATVLAQTISVVQAQKDAILVEKQSYDMPFGGGGIEVKVEANVSFDVKPNTEWIHYVETKALRSSTIYLTVDENETYSAREGKIEIKQKNGTLSHTLTVKQAGRIAVTSIELNKTNLTLKEGESETLTATVKPDNATDKTVTWSSSAPNIASVDEAGNVTAIAKGDATITAQAGEKTAKCTVSVYKEIPVSSIELDKTSLSLVVGDEVTLGATVKPDDATNKAVVWSSSDDGVATVDDSGKVSALKEGNAIITAMAEGKKATCSVSVESRVPTLNTTSNTTCFIITKEGLYRIACGTLVSNGANKAFVLWNENGENDIINVSLDGNYVYFKKSVYEKGNAVISIAKDNEILMSWHIWSTDEPKFIDGIMDRNLGATSAAKNDENSYGLLYSYGSPFPFPGAKYKDWTLTANPSVPDGWYVAPGYGFYAANKRPTKSDPMLYCTNEDVYGNSEFWRSPYAEAKPYPEGTRMMSSDALQELIGYEPSFGGLNGVLLKNGLFIPAAGSERYPNQKGVYNVGLWGGYWGNRIYNNAAVDAFACWFYEGFSKASSYYRGNTLHSIRVRK